MGPNGSDLSGLLLKGDETSVTSPHQLKVVIGDINLSSMFSRSGRMAFFREIVCPFLRDSVISAVEDGFVYIWISCLTPKPVLYMI